MQNVEMKDGVCYIQLKDGEYPVAALFDLDGVVIDTETQYSVLWDGVCKKYLGLENGGNRLKGMTLEHIFDAFFHDFDDNAKMQIKAELDQFEAGMKMDYIPGAEAFIKDLKAHGVKLAIVTSSNEPKMQSVYRSHPEIKTMFDRILTAEMFTRSKPEPDCYLLGASVFNTVPDACFVFEDSINGLKSGKAAGMTVVGLSTTNAYDAVLPYSAVVLSDFEGYTYKSLMSLLTKKNA